MKKASAPKPPPVPEAPPVSKPSPQQLAEWEKVLASLPDENRAVVISMLAANPGAAALVFEALKPVKDKAKHHEAWIQRQSKILKLDTKHSPVTAAYVGKAMAVRTAVDPRNSHAISKPDIFGVFASQKASGVLPKTGKEYAVALACANVIGRSKVTNKVSNRLTRPLERLEQRAIAERSHIAQRWRLCEGCQGIFDDSRIPWPKPVSRSKYVEPTPLP